MSKREWLEDPTTKELSKHVINEIDILKEEWSYGRLLEETDNYASVGAIVALRAILEWIEGIRDAEGEE